MTCGLLGRSPVAKVQVQAEKEVQGLREDGQQEQVLREEGHWGKQEQFLRKDRQQPGQQEQILGQEVQQQQQEVKTTDE